MDKIILDIKKELKKRGISETRLAEMAGLPLLSGQKKVNRLLRGDTKRLDTQFIKTLLVTLGMQREGMSPSATVLSQRLDGACGPSEPTRSNSMRNHFERLLEPSEFVLVPRYNVSGSCGGGVLVEGEEVVEYLSFRREWIKNSLRIGVNHLAVISVKGDSMEPRLRDGDVVLLDTSANYVEDNAIYALQFNGGLSIKRVQRFMSGAMKIISDNAAHYAAEDLTPEQAENVRVVGRVVWAGGKV